MPVRRNAAPGRARPRHRHTSAQSTQGGTHGSQQTHAAGHRNRRAALALTVAPAASAQQWKPTKPITIIVPWAAGGSTDQVTRVTAAEIEKALGQKVIIVNQPGASGSIGTKNALEAREGRLHVDGRRGAGPRHVRGARHARHQDRRLGAVPQRRQRLDARRESEHAVQDAERAHRRDEGEAGRDQRRDGRRQLERPQRDGGDRQGDRRQVQARHLRRRQSGGGRDGRRRDRRDDAAHRRAGRDDPRQEAAARSRSSATSPSSSTATASSSR